MKNNLLVQGYTRIACPVEDCRHIHQFTETTITIRDKDATARRRRTYLTLQHEAGRHADRG
jgi:hypothetical protein